MIILNPALKSKHNMEKEELIALLEENNIPLEAWGTGEAKTIDHLLKEICDGESTLVQKDGMLLRSASGSVIRIYYRNGQATLYLKEERQVFKDGREKKRKLPGNMSIAEKLKPGEIPAVGAWRALSEELGITEKLPLIPRSDIVRGPVPSISYPGLQTLYTIYSFEVSLPERWYKPEGYIEKQEDKTSYFIWMELSADKDPQ